MGGECIGDVWILVDGALLPAAEVVLADPVRVCFHEVFEHASDPVGALRSEALPGVQDKIGASTWEAFDVQARARPIGCSPSRQTGSRRWSTGSPPSASATSPGWADNGMALRTWICALASFPSTPEQTLGAHLSSMEREARLATR